MAVKIVNLSFPEGLVESIDRERGDIPRSKFVRRIVEQSLTQVPPARIDSASTLAKINAGRGAPDKNGVSGVNVVTPTGTITGPKDASMSIGYGNRSVIQRSAYP